MGRGSSKAGKGGNGTKPYGSDFKTVYKHGNIKFIKTNNGSNAIPMWTKTNGRVYAVVDKNKNSIKSIVYFDKNNNRSKQIDLDREHHGIRPHTHHGYFHNEKDGAKGASNLTAEERKMVDRINKLWYNYLNK